MNTGTNYADRFFSTIPNDADTLENNVKEYPFSSVARFLLLYHYKKNNNVAFENFATQTGIYINNPFWLQYQLSKMNDQSFSSEDSSQFEIQNKNIDENFPMPAEGPALSADQQIMQIPVSENEVFNENEIKINSFEEEKNKENIEENIPVAAEESDLTADQQIMPVPLSENEVINENEIKINSFEEEKNKENIEENIPSAEEEIKQIPVSENEVFNETEIKNNSYQEEKNNENIEENFPVAAEESDLTAGQQIMPIPLSENEVINENEIKINSFEEEKNKENIEENIPMPAEEQIMQIPFSKNEVFNETEIKNNSDQEEKQNENIEQNIPFAAEEQIMQIPVFENNPNQEEIRNEKFEENIPAITEESDLPADKQIMQISASENETIEETAIFRGFETELKKPGNNEEDLIPFEPLHTVDYFASQGIKISEEALENDHLGKQVKSFTAWLKSMKKLHPGQMPEQNEVIEKIIQANAEVSNQNANVLTEAMAEVLIKQNKKEKAIEMYQKLSLINPSKSAYFAAKIESLKII